MDKFSKSLADCIGSLAAGIDGVLSKDWPADQDSVRLRKELERTRNEIKRQMEEDSGKEPPNRFGMTTADIEPCEGYFVDISDGDRGPAGTIRKHEEPDTVHVIHSCELANEELTIKGVMGCYIAASPSIMSFGSFVHYVSLFQQYYEVEHDEDALRQSFDAYCDGKPVEVASFRDLAEGNLRPGTYFVTDPGVVVTRRDRTKD